MKSKLNKLKQHPKYHTVLNWTKLISITGSAQIMLQVLGFISGILVIRLLPTQEYALYTIANTLLGSMVVLSDAGINTGVMSQGGRVWQDREKLGAVVVTGLDLRKRFSLICLVIATPILIYLFVKNGSSYLMAIMIVLSLIPAFYAALSDSLLEITFKLNQSIVPLQKNQVGVGIGRLMLSAILLFIFPWSFMAVLANGVPLIFGNMNLKKMSVSLIDLDQKSDPEVQKNILKIVKKSLPALLFYCFSGQITIWIVSFFGNVSTIAQIGALGRFAALLNLFNVLIGTLVIPRFSRLENNKLLLLKRYSQILFVCSLLMVGFIVFMYLFSDKILWILGKNYSSLNFELILILISACLNIISGVAFGLYGSKGWVLPPVFTILRTIIIVIVACFVFDMSTISGVLYLNIVLSVTSVISDVCFGYYNLIRLKPDNL